MTATTELLRALAHYVEMLEGTRDRLPDEIVAGILRGLIFDVQAEQAEAEIERLAQ